MKRIKREYYKKLPPKSKSVTRPGRWGNPYKVSTVGGKSSVLDKDNLLICTPKGGYSTVSQATKMAVKLYRLYLADEVESGRLDLSYFDGVENVACFCHLDAACHGDVIIEMVEDYRNDKKDNSKLA